MKKLTIKRGGIYLLDNDDAYGQEIKKRRPFIVVSNPNFTAHTGFTLVVPITSVSHEANAGYVSVETDCDVTGEACWVQAKSVDLAARNPKYLGQLSQKSLQAIRTGLNALLTY